jgi:hypothetical protein
MPSVIIIALVKNIAFLNPKSGTNTAKELTGKKNVFFGITGALYCIVYLH